MLTIDSEMMAQLWAMNTHSSHAEQCKPNTYKGRSKLRYEQKRGISILRAHDFPIGAIVRTKEGLHPLIFISNDPPNASIARLISLARNCIPSEIKVIAVAKVPVQTESGWKSILQEMCKEVKSYVGRAVVALESNDLITSKACLEAAQGRWEDYRHICRLTRRLPPPQKMSSLMANAKREAPLYRQVKLNGHYIPTTYNPRNERGAAQILSSL